MNIKELWRFETGGAVSGCPGIFETPEGPLVVTGTDDGEVIALDGTGAEVWRDSTGVMTAGWPVVVDLPAGKEFPGGKTLLIGDTVGTVHAYSPDGTVRWRKSMGEGLQRSESFNSGISPWSGIAAFRGAGDAAIVVTDRCGNVSALTADGDLVWRVNLDKEIGVPAVGDIDGDGQDEIISATWSGRVHCLGGDGTLRWTTDGLRIEAAYHSPLIADWGEGPRVLVLGERDGVMRCLDAAGSELWRHTSRGAITSQAGAVPVRIGDEWRLFVPNSQTGQQILSTTGEELWYGNYSGGNQPFGPSVADVDGDGNPELLMTRRSFGAKTLWVLNTDGEALVEFDMEGSMTGAPVAGDINGDGIVEFIIVNESTGVVRALCIEDAQPGGQVQWATGKGPFDGRRSILSAQPDVPAMKPEQVESSCDVALKSPAELVTGKQPVVFEAGGCADALFQTTVSAPGKPDVSFVSKVSDTEQGWIEATAEGTYAVQARLFNREGVLLAESGSEYAFVPFAPERKRGEDLLELMTSLAAELNDNAFGRQARNLSDRWEGFKRRMNSGESDPVEVREFLDHMNAVATRRRAAHDKGVSEFLVWNPGHPWAAWNPKTDAPADTLTEVVSIRTEQRAHEATALTVANVTGKPLTVRLWLDKDNDLPESAVTLRKPVFVGTATGKFMPDALPALDEAGLVTIPADETARVWIDWSAEDLAPGTHETTLHIRALSVPSQEWDVAVSWDVLPTALPEESPLAFHVWAYQNAKIFHSIDAVYEDLFAHHVNTFDFPTPGAKYDADGNIVESDFSAIGEIIDRVPDTSFFLWHGQDTIASPAEDAPPVGSPVWKKAFHTHVTAFMDFLKSKGVGYDRHANYIIDEPGIEGGRRVDLTVRCANLYHEVDPDILIFTNPAGGATAEHIDRLLEVASILDPIWHGDDPGYVHLPTILEKADTVWTYNCGDGVRDLANMSYYWSMIWKGAQWGMTGIGHWSYAGRTADFWQGTTPNGCDWELVYPAAGSIVPSRRWQGVRLGVEDSMRLTMVKNAAEAARSEGDDAQAEKLETARAGIIARVVDAKYDEIVVAEARRALQDLLL